MFHNPFYKRAPRGLSWVAILLIALAIVFFGHMVLAMVFRIAFTFVHLVFDVAVLAIIVFALFYVIRFVSRKTEGKGT
jgi:inner membrane protein involved in colicin E2 resistance